MAASKATSKVKVYIQNHWIKIGIAGLFLFVLMKKDLSFSINLNAPTLQEEVVQPPDTIDKKKKEVLSEKVSKKEQKTTQFSVSPLDILLAKPPSRNKKLWALEDKVRTDFIHRFSHVAENEQLKYGVPAAVTLACGIFFSEAGQNDMAKTGNNYFALPCTADWLGSSGEHESECYRYYENAWTSFRDNSLYLTTYLFPGKQIPTHKYKSWIKALQQVKYGNEVDLEEHLLEIIDHYNLQKFN